MSPRRVILIKLGGSLITDKSGREAVRADVLARLAAELSEVADAFDGGLVLAHGSGSFGHVAATEAGWSSAGERPSNDALARTQDAAGRLHRVVVAALLEAGLKTFSLAPASLMVSSNGHLAGLNDAPLVQAIRNGLLPVLFGDVVLDSEQRARIYSTERVFLSIVPALLAKGFEIPAAFWLGDTDGVLDETGETIERVDRANAGRIVEGLRAGAQPVGRGDQRGVRDVTGGMRHRLESALALARLGVPSWIFSGAVPGRLARAVDGERVPGTIVSVSGPVRS